MRDVDRKKQLFENIVRLRRAGRDATNPDEISAVRVALEGELGETVSQRLAGSLLGVSHTALARWIDSGDLPVLYTPAGRLELPVAALLDLYEAVQSERESGRRSRHVLEPVMSEGRRRARRLRPTDLVPDHVAGIDGHRRAELRSLAYHRALADRLRRPMVDEARHVLGRWRSQDKIDDRYAQQWEDLLRRPIPEIRRILGEDSQTARDLRQTSPFAGMLSEPERRRIIQEIR